MLLHPLLVKRQKRFIEALGPNSVAILFSAEEIIRTGDSVFPFRQNSDFHYLTAFPEPGAIAVFLPGRPEGEYVLFNRCRDRAREIWDGHRAGQEGAIQNYGASQAFPIEQIDTLLPGLLEGRNKIYSSMGKNAQQDQKLFAWVNGLRAKVRAGVVAPQQFISIDSILHEMRLIKDAYELELMRKGGEISAQAHCEAMKKCQPGMFEYELEAILQYEFYRHGSRFPAYTPIIGAGANGCILHYVSNDSEIKDGDLVLIDAGAEWQNYSSDITRTFPANGRFSSQQREIYELVLAAQLAGIAEVKPGQPWDRIQAKMIEVLTQGLLDLGLLKGNVSDCIANKDYFKFYMHNSGHWLGLDTHDVGNYKVDQKWRVLQPGMVLTVEPGLYLSADIPGLPEQYHNIGIRIEDDVVVTDSGCEILTASVPKQVEEIERLMN